MGTKIGILVGIISGILFSFAFPDPALAVNELIRGTIDAGIQKLSGLTLGF